MSQHGNIALRMKGVTKRFPGVLANDHIDLELKVGEVHGLLGENGAGKTTLMNILYGLHQPDSGETYVEDACEGADVVYAKNHVCLDLLPPEVAEPQHDEMEKLFGKYQGWITDEKRMNLARPGAHYMHCLPCERGFEVSNEVLDGPWGLTAFNEAENRLHAQKGVMACIIP